MNIKQDNIKKYAGRWGWLVDSGLRAAYFRQQGGEENINLQAIQNGKKINLKETNVCGSKIK